MQPKRRMSFESQSRHEDDSLARNEKLERRLSVGELASVKQADLPKIEKDKVQLLRIDLDDPKSKS